jgi:hypothetical protein
MSRLPSHYASISHCYLVIHLVITTSTPNWVPVLAFLSSPVHTKNGGIPYHTVSAIDNKCAYMLHPKIAFIKKKKEWKLKSNANKTIYLVTSEKI